jgi:hypothetical protein
MLQVYTQACSTAAMLDVQVVYAALKLLVYEP